MSDGSDPTTAEGPSETKPRKKKIPGVIAIDQERCKGCGFCVSFCPLGVLAMSAKFNAKGYHYPEVLDDSKCTGCGLCGMYCPDFAIHGARGQGVVGSESNETPSDAE
jgi:2-oxoglutarate ferredoxin oxidoreductase subunit delta